MKNDQPCSIEDIASAKICMYDTIKRIEIQVRFISNIRINFISLGMLNSYSLEWSSKKYVLDVRSRDKIR